VRAIFDGRGGPLEEAQSRHKPAAFPPERADDKSAAREQYRAVPDAALYVIANGGHDAIFRAARPDFVRTTLAFLGG
jgi:hypothetical protein